MTVKELIDALTPLDPDLPVIFRNVADRNEDFSIESATQGIVHKIIKAFEHEAVILRDF